MQPAPLHEPASLQPTPPPGGRALLAAIVVAGIGLRLCFSLRRGLILDEFHSLFHASATSWNEFFGALLLDNHPPLSFLLVGAARRLLGDSELALRTPSLLFGGLTIALTWSLGQRLPGRWTAPVAAGLVALSGLHMDVSAQARMYALAALCVLGLTEATLRFLATPDEREPREAGLAVAFWIAIGLHTHYYVLHYLAIASGALLTSALLCPHPRAQLRRLVPYVLAGAVLWLPWAWYGFRAQLEHGLPPGMSRASVAQLGESLVHLVYMNLSLLGAAPRLVFMLAGIVALALALLGAARLYARCLISDGIAAPLLLLGLAVGVPIWSFLVALVQPRAGFNWQYLVPSVPAFALLIGVAMDARARTRFVGAALAFVGLSALLLTSAYAVTRGREPYREAIDSVLAVAAPGDALVAVEFQPPLFDQGMAWDYYAPRSSAASGAFQPPRLDVHHEHYHLLDSAALQRHARVFLLRRSLPEDAGVMLELRERYPLEDVRNWGDGLWVHTFEREPSN